MTTEPIKIAIAGANGRMGWAVATAAEAEAGVEVVARFGRPGAVGEGLVSMEAGLAVCDVVVDFTTAAASTALAAYCAARFAAGGGPALVIGTTGFDLAQLDTIRQAGETVAVVRAGNFSLGVNLLMGLVRKAAQALPADYDIEIFEAHHRRKVDAPSGTALMLGAAAAEGRGVNLADVERRARDGITGARPMGEIGFSVVRAGGIIGDHSVIFAAEQEVLTLSHSSRDRGLFARGALAAAVWAAHQPPGEYDMQAVLGL
ncbi:4-hydroxy-tetrahydrodipicolinate reductase [Phenylobacterium immobile]|uniref:4-hydroxy-tetrahydrodipicolinate reductase n=1 Tax=Phenylobacterium immobile TaxID=21 RepID=UPI000A914337|nr:4-hydroxy-tetrahydrodipicolinate reductase [Phenylobacterium immobile]